MNTNKTISLVSILSLFVAGAASAYTPKTMINDKLVNVEAPYGLHSEADQDKLWSVNTNAFYLHQRLGETATHEATSNIGGIVGSGSMNLDELVEGLSLNVHVPIVYTRNTTETKKNEEEGTKSSNTSNNEIAINDIDVAVSYDVLNQDGQEVTLSAGVTIPTAGKHNHFNIAEPRLGNGGHIGLFLDVDAKNSIFSNDDHNVSIVSGLTYRYLFSNTQKRAIAAIAGDEESSKEINITPGSQLDGRIGLLYDHSSGIFLGTGVTGYYRSREEAQEAQSENTAESVERPAQLTFRGYADLGYNFEVYELPAFVSVGVNMPMVTKTWETKECNVATTENFFKNNKFFNNVDFNVKAGISF